MYGMHVVSGLSNSSKSDTTCGLSSDQEGMRIGVQSSKNVTHVSCYHLQKLT